MVIFHSYVSLPEGMYTVRLFWLMFFRGSKSATTAGIDSRLVDTHSWLQNLDGLIFLGTPDRKADQLVTN